MVTGPLQRDTSSSRTAIWGRWMWDGFELTAEVDPFGFRRMFYAKLGKGVAVADTITELLEAGANRDFDDAAVATFLRMGFFLGEDTPFKSIRAFPVGGKLTWSRERGLGVLSRPTIVKIDSSIGKAEAMSRYVDLFRTAVQKSLPPDQVRTVLPLSGGRDSRHIAFELHRCRFSPGLVMTQRHMAYRADEDARVAGEITKALGWSHQVIDQSDDALSVEHEKNQWFEGTVKEHAWIIRSAAHVRDSSCKYVFDGIAGDVLSNGLFVRKEWNKALDERRYQDLFRAMAGIERTDSAVHSALRADLATRWSYEAAFHRWKEEFDRFADEEDPISRFMFANRTRRAIAPLWQCLDPSIEIITPYLDADVYTHLVGLPRRLFESQDFHDEAIALAAPQFSAIPYENKESPGDPRAHEAALTLRVAKTGRYWRSSLLNLRGLRPRLAAALLVPGAARRFRWIGAVLPQIDGLGRIARLEDSR